MNKTEAFFIILGCFAAIVNGGLQPAIGIVNAKLIAVSFKRI